MKKSTTAARMHEIMDARNLKQVDILNAAKPYCEKYGVKLTKADLSQYVNGKVEPGQEKLSILGMALDVSEAWLMGYDVLPQRNMSIPYITSDPQKHVKVMFQGERIRSARNSAGLTQKELAEKLNVKNTTISNWEKNLSRPDPDDIEHLCRVLNVEPNYLFSFEETKETLLEKTDSEHYNVLKIAGRNGSYQERRLTDQQLAALVAILDQMPDVPDDL